MLINLPLSIITKQEENDEVVYCLDLRKWTEPYLTLKVGINPIDFAIHYLSDLHKLASSKDDAGLTEQLENSYG